MDTSQVQAAMAHLGVAADSSWEEAKRRYRALVLASHPDLDPTSPEATDHTAALNAAWAALVEVTDNGARPFPHSPSPAPAPPSGPPATVTTLRAKPGDVFLQLLDAAHEIGDVSYMDPEAGLIQVLLSGGDPAASQLLIAVDAGSDPPVASFTLDAMSSAPAPHIRDIVDAIEDHLLAHG